MVSRLSLLWMLLVSLALVGSGCPSIEDPWKRVVPDDDDATADDDDATVADDDDSADDDDATPVQEPPVLVITDPDPAVPPDSVSGEVTLQFTISDADSSSVTVGVRFGVAGTPDTPATLLGQPGNTVEVIGAAPMSDVAGSVTWDSEADVETVAADGIIELCPVDAEGNAGDCVTFPEGETVEVANGSIPNAGSFCQPGVLEAMDFTEGEATVALSDGVCLNYEYNQPPQAGDFSSQFLLVLVNPNESDVNFQIRTIEDPGSGDDDDAVGDDDDAVGDDDDATADDDDATANDDDSAVGDDDDDDATADDDDSAVGDDDDSAAPYVAGTVSLAPTPGAVKTLRSALRPSWTVPSAPNTQVNCTADLTEADVLNDNIQLFLRSGISEEERSARGANLMALGTTVAIYVDEETPIDIDQDCSDPSNPIQFDEDPAFGFNNCDLEQVVDAIDNNIMPTVTGLFGELSDVDQNCRLTVFVSHRLNTWTDDDADQDNDSFLVRSFVEPEKDLWLTDINANPNSNQREVVYLYAPDPVGYWGNRTIQVDDWVNYQANGQIAIAMQDLVNYTATVGIGKVLLDPNDPTDQAAPERQEDWLNDSLSRVAADVAGFGSVNYLDAWVYMDRSHLLPLEASNELGSFQDRGGQYLFARYLHDLFGDQVLWDIVHAVDPNDPSTPLYGKDAIRQALGLGEATEDEDPFDDFALQWGTAMAVSGRILPGSNPPAPLVAPTVVPPFSEPTTAVVANPQAPQPGELYGANGFQLGFDVRGINRTYQGGTDLAGPTEVEQLRVKTENLDPLVFHPQWDFFGKVSASYGVAVVLVSGLEQPENWLLIETDSGDDLLGNIIRIEDANPHQWIVSLEAIDGAKLTTTRSLGELRTDGSETRVIGRVDPSDTLDISVDAEPDVGDDDDAAGDDDDDVDDTPTEIVIFDTDRYSFSLPSTSRVGVWVDRRIADLNGAVALTDPFVAVVPASDVPNAANYNQWDFGPSPSDGPCADASVYLYPVVMPEYLDAQANLIPDPVYTEDFDPSPDPDGLDAWTCEFDHDQDGLADFFEQEPLTLIDQIVLRQYENLLDDPSFYDSTFGSLPGAPPITGPFYGPWFVDVDSNEEPDDNLATAFPSENIGGRAVSDGEEAVWLGVLPAGDYVLVVGDGSGGEGPYDLSVRLLP